MGVLDEILENKRDEIRALRAARLPDGPAPRAVDLSRPPGAPLRLIAEIKRRSPSAGPLSTRLDVGDRARVYARAGASMISVLCDRRYFDGDYAHLSLARRTTNVPILCKEFVLDEIQLDAARAHGADAVLLIVRCLDDATLSRLVEAARARQLTPLVEVHSAAEVPRALDAGATFVGVNARDLDALRMDRTAARVVLDSLPEGVVSVHLSGLRNAKDVSEVAQGPAHAALIGEGLMRQDDPEPLLKTLVAAAATT